MVNSGPLRCARNGRGDGHDGKQSYDHGGEAGGDCEKRQAFEGHEGRRKKTERKAGVERIALREAISLRRQAWL